MNAMLNDLAFEDALPSGSAHAMQTLSPGAISLSGHPSSLVLFPLFCHSLRTSLGTRRLDNGTKYPFTKLVSLQIRTGVASYWNQTDFHGQPCLLSPWMLT